MPPTSLAHALHEVATADPTRLFARFEGGELSYGQLLERICQAAGALADLGIGRGDRVAIYLDNSPEFIETYFAALWLGAVAVPVNTRYRQVELGQIISDSGACLLVTEPALQQHLATVGLGNCGVLSLHDGLNGVTDGSNTGKRQPSGFARPHSTPGPLAQSDLAVILYTSGTTGRSRGAMLSHGNFIANAAAVTKAWAWTHNDHLLLSLPLFHTHGLSVGLHGTVLAGASMSLHRRFEPAAVLDELGTGAVSLFFGVPTMYGRLVAEARKAGPDNQRAAPGSAGAAVRHAGEPAAEEVSVSSSRRDGRPRLFVSGSAPLSPQTLHEVEELFGLRILERYGMTETCMNVGNPLEGERKPGSVGLPFEGVELRITEHAGGRLLAPHEVGEIQLRGPNVSAGYWRNPEATQAAFTADGWFKTGDLGYRDEDGYLFISGRSKELIISGGFNVYPREVEEVLEQHPGVIEAAVIGLPDADLGERVVAAVVAAEPRPTVAELLEHCAGRIAAFKKPREIVFLEVLPRNALGKLEKHRVREALIGPPGRPVGRP